MKLLIRTTILVLIHILAIYASDVRNWYAQHLHDIELQLEAGRQRNLLQPGNPRTGQTQPHPQLQRIQQRARDPNQPYTLEQVDPSQPFHSLQAGTSQSGQTIRHPQPRNPNQPYTLERVDPIQSFHVYHPREKTLPKRRGQTSLRVGTSQSEKTHSQPRLQNTPEQPQDLNRSYALERVDSNRPFHVHGPREEKRHGRRRGKEELLAGASRSGRIQTPAQVQETEPRPRDPNKPYTLERVDPNKPIYVRTRDPNEPYTLDRVNPNEPIYVRTRDPNEPYTLERVDPNQPINLQRPKEKQVYEQRRGKKTLGAGTSQSGQIETPPQLLQQERQNPNGSYTLQRLDERQPDPEQLPRHRPRPRIEEPDTRLKL